MKWQQFKAGLKKATSDTFRGYNLNPASELEPLPPVEVEGPMTEDRAVALLDKIRRWEKHMKLRPLFNGLEDRMGYAQVERNYTTALILAEEIIPRKIKVD